MSHSDSNFYKSFAFVLGALVFFTLFIIFVANSLSPDAGDDPLALAEQQKFIAPIGQSRVVGGAIEQAIEPAIEQAPKAVAKPATVAQTTATPKPEVETAEPKVAESATVETVEVKTTETAPTVETTKAVAATAAVASAPVAISTAAESLKVRATVATNCAGCHNTGLDGAAKPNDSEAWAALAEKGIGPLTMSVINGKGKMPARAESNLSDEELSQAVQLMVEKATGGKAVAAAPAATSAATTAAATTAAAPAVVVEAPAAPAAVIPEEVKTVVDSTCAACHIAGVANAPKFGDVAAWAPRKEKGIDALTASAIAGIGAMPPRGASALDDAQMKLAVEYMLSK